MFVFSGSPCIFESFTPICNEMQNCSYPSSRRLYKRPMGRLNYSVEEQDDKFIISLRKDVPEELLYRAVEERVNAYKERAPRYSLVTDFFGNQYCVQNHVDQQQLLCEAMRNIDMNELGSHLAQMTFHDYQVTLSADGHTLVVESADDNVHKEFELQTEFEDVAIENFEMARENTAIVKIALKKPLPRPQKRVCTSIPVMWHNTKSRKNSQKLESGDALDGTTSDVPREAIGENQHELRVNGNGLNAKSQSVNRKFTGKATTEMHVTIEDLEDEEFLRWERSLGQAPKGHAIIEDAA
ncbi:AFR325Wp [Eremothecium gossypii ATCC 10895]|uniref:AFR325Wp n=1 Tax=Eremothecium gossypii (strain ATCC 10895 / CBS 109.51 / FGSC 9923 / NRRL Y-1056) TaxID=284811 RepID=Q753I7_EREGS|nr:AFR325Wp [Eremothecium gossypii ATCC 10895]AAS53696.1 AFR325Wp [Eremothecium gossypii ATCC 10895]AEY98009.1 FAFR325Wp [Eremothecium gossypii FDAG1]